MQRADFHKIFQCSGPVILPVIHVLDDARTAANIDHIIDAGLKGCFLINHDFGIDAFLPVLDAIRGRYPDFWIGVNFLAVTGLKAFPILADLDERGALGRSDQLGHDEDGAAAADRLAGGGEELALGVVVVVEAHRLPSRIVADGEILPRGAVEDGGGRRNWSWSSENARRNSQRAARRNEEQHEEISH